MYVISLTDKMRQLRDWKENSKNLFIFGQDLGHRPTQSLLGMYVKHIFKNYFCKVSQELLERSIKVILAYFANVPKKCRKFGLELIHS